jgi:segregation and condensation protein A
MSDEIISAIPELVPSPEGESPEFDAKNLTHVKLPVFEGPLDLLLYLIKKDELDIYDIPIEKITSQYLDYLRIIKMLDLEVAGDYLVVAATLLYIKSRVLLPHDQRPPEEEAEEDDPRWELVRQLVEYKKYKDAAFELQQCLVRQEGVHGRGAQSKPDMELDGSMPFDKVGLFDLLSVFQKILDRANKNEDLRDIFEDKFTVSDKIQFILGTMTSRSRVVFEELFSDGATRTEVVVTFLAVLELIRLKQIGVTQDGVFGAIELVKLAPAQSDFVAPADNEVAEEVSTGVTSTEETLAEEAPAEVAPAETAAEEEPPVKETPASE